MERKIGFKIKGEKSGSGNDATFQNFICLATADPYEYQKKREKKLANVKPFIPSSPTKSRVGLGTDYGCFNKITYQPRCDMICSPRKKFHNVQEKKCFVTGLSRSFLIGDNKIIYYPEPYGGDPRKLKPKREKSPTPFKAMCKPGNVFDNKSLNPYSGDGTFDAPKRPRERPKTATTCFRYSSPIKTGYNCTIGKFPEYIVANNNFSSKKKVRPQSAVITRPFRAASPPASGFNCTLGRIPEYFGGGIKEDSAKSQKKKERPNSAVIPFRCSSPPRTGYNCTIGRFPEYLLSPPPPRPIFAKAPPSFKTGGARSSSPTPSIANRKHFT